MKKMSKEAQMQKNGGAGYWHCHKCNKTYYTLGKLSKAYSKHISAKGHTGTAYLGEGQLKYCPNLYK